MGRSFLNTHCIDHLPLNGDFVLWHGYGRPSPKINLIKRFWEAKTWLTNSQLSDLEFLIALMIEFTILYWFLFFSFTFFDSHSESSWVIKLTKLFLTYEWQIIFRDSYFSTCATDDHPLIKDIIFWDTKGTHSGTAASGQANIFSCGDLSGPRQADRTPLLRPCIVLMYIGGDTATCWLRHPLYLFVCHNTEVLGHLSPIMGYVTNAHCVEHFPLIGDKAFTYVYPHKKMVGGKGMVNKFTIERFLQCIDFII